MRIVLENKYLENNNRSVTYPTAISGSAHFDRGVFSWWESQKLL